MTTEINQEIVRVIEQQIRPYIMQDGGDIEFVNFKEGTVYIKFHGACTQCPISLFTLKYGIEEQLKLHIPSIEHVVALD